tara:strand:+ start:45 stop:725 length:681 start_codon:yes stop_codon:yes gene_type:complete
MAVYPYFSTPIYTNDSFQTEYYNDIQKELMDVYRKTEFEKLEGRPETSHSTSPSAFCNNVLKKYKCKHFLKFLNQEVQSYVKTFGNDIPLEYIIDSAWLTKTMKGEHALQHSHGSTDISGVYYLKTNGKDGNIFFQDPNSCMVGNLIMDLAVNVTNCELPLQQGLIHMWPGYMSHGTRYNQTDDERLSLSFNIQFTRRGLRVKETVDKSDRALVVRHPGWSKLQCY